MDCVPLALPASCSCRQGRERQSSPSRESALSGKRNSLRELILHSVLVWAHWAVVLLLTSWLMTNTCLTELLWFHSFQDAVFQHTLLQIWHHNLLTTNIVFTTSQKSQKINSFSTTHVGLSDYTRSTQKLQMTNLPKTKMGLIYETKLGDVLSFLLWFFFSCSALQ